MRKAIEEFKDTGQPYFSAQELDACVNEIASLAPNPLAEFYQLSQQADDLRLEYAALIAGGIVDLTLTKPGLAIATVPLRAISEVMYIIYKAVPPESARLEATILLNGPTATPALMPPAPVPYIRYTATQLASASRLRLFCAAIQRALLAG